MSPISPSIRGQFPILSQEVEGNPLVYLDTAATAQKPECVIDAMSDYYTHDNANVKRGMHVLAERSTQIYEDARKRVKEFVNARSSREIVFTKNTTEGVNTVARSYAEENLKKGDVVLLSILEHHSNIVPWLQLKERLGIEIEWIGIDEHGALKMEDADRIIASGSVKLMCITCVSNVYGIHTDYIRLTHDIHTHGGKVLLDAAQLAPHAPIDVQEIDCDFLVFSGHKVYGPMGIGVLYGKQKFLDAMPPALGGGMMIENVTCSSFDPTHAPEKFEAGTPPVAEARGLHVALDWLTEIGWETIQAHEKEIYDYAHKKLSELPFITILGPTCNSSSCLSFTSTPVHPHDLTEYCGRKGICMRAGHHCAQPLHNALKVSASTRMSFGVHNTKEDIDRACEMIKEAWEFFHNA